MAYKIYYDYNGGKSDAETLNTVTGQSGYSEYVFSNDDQINLGDGIPLPTANQVKKEACVLIGWSPSQYTNGQVIEDNGNKKIYVGEYNVSKIVNNTVGSATTTEKLYAVWKPLADRTDFFSVIPQLSRNTETTQAPMDISNLLKNGTNKQKEMANTAMGIIDQKQKEKTLINKPCYVTFTVPEWGAHDPVKAIVQVGSTNDINQWKLSEAKNTTEYRENILSQYPEKSDNPSATTYMIIWSRKGVEISDTTVLSDGDILIGKVLEKSNIPNYVTAMPMVYNEQYKLGVETHSSGPYDEFKVDGELFTTVNDMGVYATNSGYVTITSGKRQVSTQSAVDIEGVKFNTTYGEKLTLTANPTDSVFYGWYRRECENMYNIKDGVILYDINGVVVDIDDIKDNGVYYKDANHTIPAVEGVDYWIATTRLGYYLVETSPVFTTRVDKDDLYNQYVAVFDDTRPEFDIRNPQRQLPIEIFNCFRTDGVELKEDLKQQIYQYAADNDYLHYNDTNNPYVKSVPIIPVVNNGVIGRRIAQNPNDDEYTTIIGVPLDYEITTSNPNVTIEHLTSVDILNNKWMGDNLYAVEVGGETIMNSTIGSQTTFNYTVNTTPRYMYHIVKQCDIIDGDVSRYNFADRDMGLTPQFGNMDDVIELGGDDIAIVFLINDPNTQCIYSSEDEGQTWKDETMSSLLIDDTNFDGIACQWSGGETDLIDYFVINGLLRENGEVPEESCYHRYCGDKGGLYMVTEAMSKMFKIDEPTS